MNNIELNGKALRLKELILRTASLCVMKKVVFSMSRREELKKCVLTLKDIGRARVLQMEIFLSDNKAKQENISLEDASALDRYIDSFDRINLITTAGDCEYKRSKSDNTALIGADKLCAALDRENVGVQSFARITPGANNKVKNHILHGGEQFLVHLGVSDKNGRVYDKKQAKFRQINRFLELIRDVEDKLPDGELRICDLCCGKSYLSFAVYHYFAVIKKRSVKMTGIDLKPDVVEYCSSVSRALGFDGLEFLCGDINFYSADEHVNLVISLHACDIATDIVLDKALAWRADIILSTPCCHHDLNRRLDCDALSFVAEHSMLRQKLCDAATDALRLKLLEAHGYDVSALELVDPDETPKNIMLRGIRRKKFDPDGERERRAAREYREAYFFLTGKETSRFD